MCHPITANVSKASSKFPEIVYLYLHSVVGARVWALYMGPTLLPGATLLGPVHCWLSFSLSIVLLLGFSHLLVTPRDDTSDPINLDKRLGPRVGWED